MSVYDSEQDVQSAVPVAVPKRVERRLERGRKEMRKDAPKRRLCVRFERGDTYVWLDEKNLLQSQSTVTTAMGLGKPRHRIRNKYNFIRPIVEEKVSAATARTPAYGVRPTTVDPNAWSAAKLAQKISQYGYDKWRFRSVRTRVIKLAIAGGGDGFALPYFDTDVGPFIQLPDVRHPEFPDDPSMDVPGGFQGVGEVKVKVFSGNEVYWEAGADFNESCFWATEQAMSKEDVQALPGYLGGALSPDASTSDIPTDQPTDDMVLVTNYYERPCSDRPRGLRLQICNARVICPPEDYPLQDAKDNVLDEPLLHRLSYTVDPETDRDFGLVWQLIDAQRTLQDCWNKLLEWKNRTLNPQMLVPFNSVTIPRDDEPGANVVYKGTQAPTWETPPPVPQALFQMLDAMKADMQYMAAYQDIQADANVSSTTVNAVLSQSQARWGSFLADLAEFDSRLMRHCLLLVSRFYTEPRMINVQGYFGAETISNFRGADLLDQQMVTVSPESLQMMTTQDIQNRLNWLALTFPGFLTPEIALAMLDGGNMQQLENSYELDYGRITMIIQAIRDGSIMTMPTRTDDVMIQVPVTDPVTGVQQVDPATGMPMTQPKQVQVQNPIWMPMKDVDNLNVWKKMMGDFAKTGEYQQGGPEFQEPTKLIMSAIAKLEMEKAQEQAELQAAQAEQLGMANAGKPAGLKPMPSTPGSQGSPPPAP